MNTTYWSLLPEDTQQILTKYGIEVRGQSSYPDSARTGTYLFHPMTGRERRITGLDPVKPGARSSVQSIVSDIETFYGSFGPDAERAGWKKVQEPCQVSEPAQTVVEQETDTTA